MIIITVDELQVIITANTASLTAATASVASHVNRMQAQTNAASSKMQKAFGGIGNGIAKVGKVAAIAGVAIIGALGGALVKGAADAADAQAKVAQLEAVLRSTGGAAGMSKDALIKLAEGFEKTTKFSAEAALEAESLLLTFTNIGQKTFPRATQAAADMATALGGDMKSQSIALGKALNDPIKGVSALSRVGVTFTEGQKASIKAMQESGNVAGAQAIILAELEKEFGGSATAAGKTFAGQLVILQNALSAVTEGLATTLMPYLQKFLNWINSNMPAIQLVMQKAFDVIGRVVKVVADIFMAYVLPVFNQFKTWVTANMPAIKNVLGTTFSFIGSVIKTVANIFTVYVIPAFVKFWNWIKPYMPQIKTAIKVAFDVIKGVFKIVGDYITNVVIPVYKTMAEWFFKNFPAIKNAVMQAYNYIKPSFDKLVATVKSDLMPIIMGLWDTVKKAMPGIKAIFQIVFPIIVVVIKKVIDTVTSVIKVIKGIYDLIKPKLDSVADLFSLVFGGIKKVIDKVIDVIDLFNGKKINDKDATVTTRHVTINTNQRGQSTQFAIGSRYIPYDMVAQIHKGEMIVPKSENPYANSGNGRTLPNSGLSVTITNFVNNRSQDVQSLAEELNFYMKQKQMGGSR